LAFGDEPGTSPTQRRLSLGGNVAGVDLRILLYTIGHAVQGTGLGEGALEGGERAFDRPASLLAEEGASEHAVEFAAEFRILTGRLGRVDHRRTAILDAARQLRDGGNVAWRRLERVAEQANEQQLEAVVLERRAARVLKVAVGHEDIVEVLQACGRIVQRATLRRGQRLRVERDVEGVLFAV